MVEAQAVPEVDQSLMRRALAACAIGNATEWFDYSTYGFLAIVLGNVFFPSEDPTISLLSSFAVFGVAFAIRPLGGVFFGPLGDKYGRQRILAFTILLMAGATFAAGLLPGYATIGIWAPILLVFLRLVQGFSAGGEFGGASAFLAEYSPDDRRGFLVSWIEFSAVGGFLLGSASVLLLTATIGEEALGSWGWRIPFLLAGPLGVIGLYIRLRVEDTPEFRALERSGEVSGSPFRETITQNWRPILQVIGLVIIQNAGFYIVLTYMPTYFSEQLGFSSTASSLSSVFTLVVAMA